MMWKVSKLPKLRYSTTKSEKINSHFFDFDKGKELILSSTKGDDVFAMKESEKNKFDWISELKSVEEGNTKKKGFQLKPKKQSPLGTLPFKALFLLLFILAVNVYNTSFFDKKKR